MAYNFNNLGNLESLFWGLLDEFEAYARDVYFKLGDEDEKEVSPPVENTCECHGNCGNNCTCTKDVNTNEEYTTTLSNEVLDTSLQTPTEMSVETPTENGWWRTENGWKRMVYVPVSNDNAEVSILDNTRVQVAYEATEREDNDFSTGYRHVSGSYVFQLPDGCDYTTFKAKRVDDYLTLSVSKPRLDSEVSWKHVEIE